MTNCVVVFDMRIPDALGVDVPAGGSIEFAPTARQDLEGHITLPEPFEVKLVEGAASVPLAPTTVDWAWRIVEKIPRGRVQYVAVPDGPGPVDYDDLDLVDPDTLDDRLPLTPAWQAYLDDAISDMLNGAPAALDTLNELAAALGDDASFAATVTASLTTITNSISAETLARAAADVTLGEAIVAETAARIADVDAEGTARTAAIAAEASARTTAIAAEATARDVAILARKRVQPNTVALLGASIANMAGGSGVGIYDTAIASPFTRADGYFAWANISLGGRLTLVKNAGVSGERSDQILARVTDVTNLATLPGFCILSDAATNDLLQSVASATIIANLSAICDALQAKGITVVICTVLPLAGNAAHELRQEEVNTWIRDRAGLPGFIVCDWAARWADATSTGPKTNFATDGIHPTALGAGNIGKVLADAMRPHIAGSILLPSHNLDGLTSNLNPLMVGTAGTASTGTSGSVADNWTTLRGSGSGTMSNSKVARTDGIGGAWQSLTLAGGGGQFFFYSDVASGAVAGQKWQAELEFEAADFSGITNFRVVVSNLGAGTESGYGLYQVSPSALTLDITSGVVRTPVFTVPAVATATLRTMLVFQGTAGSVKVGRFRTRRIA